MKGAVPRLAILCGAVLVLAVPSTSGAGDWPRYGGGDLITNHVGAAAAAGLSSETIQDIVTRWSVNVGGRFVASPLYAEDVAIGTRREDAIFVATNAGTVAALRAGDGAVLWKRSVSGTALIPACVARIPTPGVEEATRRSPGAIGPFSTETFMGTRPASVRGC